MKALTTAGARAQRATGDCRLKIEHVTERSPQVPPMRTAKIDVPADVPSSKQGLYEQNFQTMTKGTGRLMLFAGDQKVEHLNDDFYGALSDGTAITEDDADPEHLFRIARDVVI